jgi:hypothetical protein
MKPRTGGFSGLAFALVAFGILLLLRQTGVIAEDIRIWPIVVLALGAGLLVAVFSGRYAGGGLVLPFVLIDLGLVELLKDTGALDEDFSVWPSLLIAIGAGALIGGIAVRRAVRRGSEEVGTYRVALPPEGAGVTAARLRVRHEGGPLRVAAGSDFRSIAVLGYVGGLHERVERQGPMLVATLESEFGGGHRAWPPGRRRWDLSLKPGFPLELEFDVGGGESTIDLSGLLVNSVAVRAGASSTSIVLPERGRVGVRIQAGAASVEVRVPPQVPARIAFSGGMSSIKVDSGRFPRSGSVWESPGWDEAADRADIVIEGGAGSFTVS